MKEDIREGIEEKKIKKIGSQNTELKHIGFIYSSMHLQSIHRAHTTVYDGTQYFIFNQWKCFSFSCLGTFSRPMDKI